MKEPPYTVADWPSKAAYAEALRRDGFYVALESSAHRGASPLCLAIFGEAERPKRRHLSPTQGISGRRFRELHQAVSFANLKGHVLNTFVTIAWSTLSILSDAQIGAVRGGFIELMRHWLRERGIPCSWIWVDEAVASIGRHTHLIVYVPKVYERGFASYAAKALTTATCTPLVTNQPRENGEPLNTLSVLKNAGLRTEDQWRMFRYLMKGVELDAVVKLLDFRHGTALSREIGYMDRRNEGTLTTQRSGFSRDLGPKSRDAYLHMRPYIPATWYEECVRVDDYWNFQSETISDLVPERLFSSEAFDQGAQWLQWAKMFPGDNGAPVAPPDRWSR